MQKIKLFALLALLSIFAGLAARPAVAADPFYTGLLERGVRDLELGLLDKAQQKLRTACFGFLDEPTLLAEGLMQLGRAQAQAGNSADLIETVERLEEIENRFNAYSDFAGPLKTDFESALRRALSRPILERMPMFSRLVVPAEQTAQTVKPQTAKQRRNALEQQLAANPGDAQILLALARLHYASGRLKPAGELLDRLLAIQPHDEQALCLRAEIAVARKQCQPALAGLPSCAPMTESNQGMAFVLECLVSARRFSEAANLLETLPIERRQERAIARAARKIDTSAGPLEKPAEGTEGPAHETQGVVFPGVKIGFTLEERIRRLRQEIAESEFREHLEEAMRHATQLADDYPDSPQAQHLAAEVAYLSSEWQAVLDYFARGGRPTADQPELLFYLAVATYERGNPQEADSILREALPNLPRNPFVDGYIDKILAPPAS